MPTTWRARGGAEGSSSSSDQPTLIIVKSVIGYGSPNKANTAAAHGAPLGAEEVRLTKTALGWPADETFPCPPEVLQHFADGYRSARTRAARSVAGQVSKNTARASPAGGRAESDLGGQAAARTGKQGIPAFDPMPKGMATRVSSGKVLNHLAPHFPWLVGGSADLAPSNMTQLTEQDAGHFSASNYAGRNFHFGIREHAMAAACNGMALSGLRPYGGTFFVFTDYMRPAMRLASLMRQGVIYVLTHDSIGLGEDGPTHQPVEHLAACRAIPRMLVFRPADANEVAESYRVALLHQHQPASIVLTRQNVPTLDRSKDSPPAAGVARGGYVLRDAARRPAASDPDRHGQRGGHLPGGPSDCWPREGIAARVVSMPCFELFDAQDCRLPRQRFAPPTSRREWAWKRVSCKAGTSIWVPTGDSSA